MMIPIRRIPDRGRCDNDTSSIRVSSEIIKVDSTLTIPEDKTLTINAGAKLPSGEAMVIGLMQGMTLTAHAAFWDGDDTPTITITESQTINESVNIYSADITLTINPGVTLTINADEVRGGITAKGQTLTVTGGGKLVVKAADNNSVGGTGGNGGNATSSAAPGGQGNQGGQGSQGGAGSVAGTFAWKNTTIAPAVSDSETTEYDVVFTPTDGNYSTAECKVKLTVNKADPTNTVGQLSAFRGQTLADVTLPTAENGVWSWGDDMTTTLNELGMTTHFAKFTPNDTNNYNTLDNVSVQIEVAEKPMAVAATVTANNRTYDGTEKPLVTVDNSTLVGGEMRYALGENTTTAPEEKLYTTSIPTATNAGTYYVWYKVKGDENHNDIIMPDHVKVTVDTAASSVTTAPKANTLTYTGQPQELVTAGTASGGAMQYALGKDDKTAPGEGWKSSIPARTEDGTYYVWYKVSGGSNHNDTAPACVTATIKPIDVTGVTLNKTITTHIAGKNNKKFTNVKKVVLKKSSYILKVGKTAQIKAQYKLVDPKKKELTDRHVPTWRYLSTDKKVAKVAKNGKIKAVGKGTCTIWVYARNGFAKKAKVTVK